MAQNPPLPLPPPPPPPPPYQQPGYGPPPGQPPYPQQQAYYPPPPPSPRPESRILLYVLIVIVVVVVVGATVALAALGLFFATAPQASQSTTVTVTPSGTVWNINAGYYKVVGPIDLASQSSWLITGAFTATNGVAAYVMDSSQYSAWGGSGAPSSYSWTSGTGVTTGSISTILPADTYYFVWVNSNSVTSTAVTITTSVLAISTSE